MGIRLAVAAGMLAAFTAVFIGLGFLAQGRPPWDPSSPLDPLIPFWPGWVWVYLLYYPLCFTPLLFPGLLRDGGLFRRAALGFSLQFVPAWACFYLFPARMERPELLGDSLSERALGLLFRVDPGYNLLPSLHVANAVFVAVLSTRFWPRRASAALFLAAGLVALSAVLVKQHYLADLPAGALLGWAAYRLSFPARDTSRAPSASV